MVREYSTKPSAVKQRLRKSKRSNERDIEILYNKPVSEWDFEELQCGKPRDQYGKISRRGKRPSWITPAVLAEAQKRLRTMTTVEVGSYSGAAIRVMVDLMESSRMDLVRFNAAKYVLDQIMGMPTQRQEITTDINVHTFLADVIVNPDGNEVGQIENIMDAVLVDEDDEQDDGE